MVISVFLSHAILLADIPFSRLASMQSFMDNDMELSKA